MAGQKSLIEKMLALVTVCSAQVGGNGYMLSLELRLEKPGLVRAAVKLSQGSVRANGGSGSGGGDQRRLVAALVTAKARKCRGQLCYGSGRDWNAQTGALTAALVATLINGGSGSDGSNKGREAQGYGRDGSIRDWGRENMK